MLFEETIGRIANPGQSSIWKPLALIIRLVATFPPFPPAPLVLLLQDTQVLRAAHLDHSVGGEGPTKGQNGSWDISSQPRDSVSKDMRRGCGNANPIDTVRVLVLHSVTGPGASFDGRRRLALALATIKTP